MEEEEEGKIHAPGSPTYSYINQAITLHLLPGYSPTSPSYSPHLANDVVL
jgi:hypothetical protein